VIVIIRKKDTKELTVTVVMANKIQEAVIKAKQKFFSFFIYQYIIKYSISLQNVN